MNEKLSLNKIDKGWEEPNPIDFSFNPYRVISYTKIKPLKNDTINTRCPHINALINNYIGRKFFFKSTKDIQKVLLDNAQKAMESYLKRKFGTLHNYQKYRIKRRWNLTYCQYKDMLAGSLGFKNKNHQELDRAKKRGVAKTYNQLQLYYVKKRGFKTRNDYAEFLKYKKDVSKK